MDFTLDDALLALQQRARTFSINEILPVVRYFDEHDRMPVFLIKRAHAAGLTNLTIETTFGGAGMGLMESAVVVEEIAAASPAMGTSIFGNTLGLEPLMMSDNEPAKRKYLPRYVKEPLICAFATSEPMMGSDVAGIRCLAARDGDGYVLNGTKYWVTNGGHADHASIFATEDPKARHKGIGAFFVDMHADGVSVKKAIPKMGHKVSNTVAVKFDNYKVPAGDVLAPPGKGFVLGMKTFSRTRPIIAAFATGAARSAMEFAIDHAKKRRVFGQPLVEMQNTQFRVAEMYQKVETMRLLMYKACWEADTGKDPTITASLAKFYATEAAQEVVMQAMQFLGGYGYTTLMPIEQIMRDIRVLTIYEGTSEVQRIVVGRHATGAYTPVMPPLDDLATLTAPDPDVAAMEGMPPQTAWRCRICGHVHHGEEPPDECPVCRFPKTAFKKTWPKTA